MYTSKKSEDTHFVVTLLEAENYCNIWHQARDQPGGKPLKNGYMP